jgi:hypothetical protein
MGNQVSSLFDFDWGGGGSVLGTVPGEMDAGYYDLPSYDMSEAGLYDIPVGQSLWEAGGAPTSTEIDYSGVPSGGGFNWQSLLTGKNLLGLAGAGLLGSGLLTSQKGTSTANQDAMNNWANQLAIQRQYYTQDRYPTKEAVSSSKASTLANINQSMMQAKEKLMEDTAARGLTGASVTNALAGLTRSGEQTKAGALTDIEKFANTPIYSSPFQVPTIPTTYNQTTATGSNIANLGSSLLGMYARNLMGEDENTSLWNTLLQKWIG